MRHRTTHALGTPTQEPVHYLSTQWIEHRQVDGKTTGRYIMDHIGTISPAP
jgi:hypothetical protein